MSDNKQNNNKRRQKDGKPRGKANWRKVGDSKKNEEERVAGVADAKAEYEHKELPPPPRQFVPVPLMEGIPAESMWYVSELHLTELNIQYVKVGDTLGFGCVSTSDRGIRIYKEGWYPILPADARIIHYAAPFVLAYRGNLQPVLHDAMKASLVDDALESIAHLGINAKGLAYDPTFLLARAEGWLKIRGLYWRGAGKMILNELYSDRFTAKVVRYHEARTRQLDDLNTARIRAVYNSMGYSSAEVDDFVVKYQNPPSWTRMYVTLSMVLLGGILMSMIARDIELGKMKCIDLIKDNLWLCHLPLFIGICFWIRYWWNRWAEYPRIPLEARTITYANLFVKLYSACVGDRELPPCRADARIKDSPKQNEPCCKRRSFIAAGLSFVGVPMVVAAQCCHNLKAALRIRYTTVKPAYKPGKIRTVIFEFKKWLVTLERAPWPYLTQESWLNHLSARRHKDMDNAPVFSRLYSYMCSAFIKLEAYMGKFKSTFKPRMITCRHDSYQNEVGCYFWNLSKYMSAILERTNLKYDSGYSAETVGSDITLMEMFKYLFELDVVNWDGCIEKEWYELEKWIVEEFAPFICPNWEEVKAEWELVRGQGYGLSYLLKHSRRSGDPWTTLFNTIINIAMVYYKFVVKGKGACSYVAKGDDGALGTDTFYGDEEIVKFYEECGMVVEVKRPHTTADMGYCSGFVWNGKWGVNPFKVLSKFGLDLHGHSPKLHKGLMLGTAISLLPIAGHVPLVSEFLHSIIDNAKGVKAIYLPYEEHKNWGEGVTPLNPNSYLQLATLSGVDVAELHKLGQQLGKLTLDDLPCVVDSPAFKHGFCHMFGCEQETSFVVETPTVWSILSKQTSDLWSFLKLYFLFTIWALFANYQILTQEVFEFFLNPFHVSNWNWHYWCIHLLGPLIEETLTKRWPIGRLFIIIAEYNPFNTVVHLLCQYLSFSNGLIVHYSWNLFVVLIHTYHLDRMGRPYANIILKNYQELLKLLKLLMNMSNNNKGNKRKQKNKPNGGVKAAVKSAMKDILRGGGALMGGALAGPSGADLGFKAGAFISKLTGFGDYKIKSNTIHNQGYSFRNDARSVRISHHEYLGDVLASSLFSVTSYALNPGLSAVFSWVAQLADAFQQYRLRGCVFYYRPTSAEWSGNGQSLGTVIMGSQYDVTKPSFTSKKEMENYMFSCSTKPSEELSHPIECDQKETPMEMLYIRTGPLDVDQDPRFFDFANFQLAVTGCDASVVGQTLGELWVAYDVEFYKPQYPPGGVLPGQYFSIVNASVTATNPLGPIQTVPYGNLPLTITATGGGYDSISFPSTISGGRFLVQVMFADDDASAAYTIPTSVTLTNCSFNAIYGWDEAARLASYFTTANGVVTNVANVSMAITINGYSPTGSKIAFAWAAKPINSVSPSVTVNVVCIPVINTY